MRDSQEPEGRIAAAISQDPYLTIVIPAFNEAKRLPPTLRKLRSYLESQSYRWEIIVVSNGSVDGTEMVVEEAVAEEPRLRLLVLAGRGKGLAVKTGALQARGDIVFICDADLSMPADNIGAFLETATSADVVVGSREAPGAHRYNEPWHRHVMGRGFNWLVQVLALKGIQDTQCGFKAFRRGAAFDLFGQQTLSGFGFDVELLYLARKYSYVIAEIPIHWYFDPDTRVRPGGDTLDMLGELLMMRLRDAQGRYRAPGTQPATEERVV